MPDCSTHTLTTLSSGSIAHTWLPASSSPDQGAHNLVVILQHGYAEYASRYLTSHHNIISHFLRSNYAIYALDLWGHGKSPGTRGVVHLGRAVRDHVELRVLVQKKESGKPVILFGHSLGGLITAGSVVTDASNVQGIILTGPALPEAIPWPARWLVGVLANIMPKVPVPRKAVPVEGLTRVTEEIEKYWADDGFHKQGISFLLAATALDTMQTVRRGLRSWTVPTMVLHGNEDPYCDHTASEKFVRDIVSVDKSLRVYSKGRHELLHDLEGPAVLKQMLEWIKEHENTTQSQKSTIV
ncbi:hypothetical protein NX059_003021 [Plenodomus lindquistii]|nr:hypothetical protein NX059_003021 [Plenodomus lindquistii]